MKAKNFLLLSLLISMCLICFSKDKKPLENKRYRYKELIRRRYDVKPFRGRIFVTYKRYLEINKI